MTTTGWQTTQFLQTLFGGLTTGEFIEVRTWLGNDKAEQKKTTVTDFCASIELAERSITRAVKGQRNTFIGAAPRSARNGKAESVKRIPALWVDVDKREDVPQFPLPPTLAVKSGHGWHLYWALDKAAEPATATAVMHQLATYVGGDAVSDAPRVMRVPGSVNYKYDPPLCCELIEHNPQASYSLSDLSLAVNIPTRLLSAIYYADAPNFKSRSERDWALIKEFTKAGLSIDTIKTVFQLSPCGEKFRDEGEHYLDFSFKKAQAEVAAEADAKPTPTKKKKRSKPVSDATGDDAAESPNDEPEFVEIGTQTYATAPKGGLYAVATFVLEPTALIESMDKSAPDAIAGELHTADAHWPVVLGKRSFSNPGALNAAMSQGSAMWVGNERQVRSYIAFLMSKLRAMGMPAVKATAQVGRFGDMWVGTEQTLTPTSVDTGNDRKLYFVSGGKESVDVAYTFPAEADYTALLGAALGSLFKINHDFIMLPVVGWFFAAPFKPILLESGIRFPHLNVFGTRGSGKSTIVKVLLRMMGLKDARSFDANTTPFVLLSLLGATNAVPVSLTEFRQDTALRLNRYLLISYDSGRDARGKADQTTQEYPMTAPLVLDGEDAVHDPATKERTILVRLKPETVALGSPAEGHYRALAALPLEDLAGHYIQHTLTVKPLWEKAYAQVRAAYSRYTVPDRVINNLAVCYMGLLHLRTFAKSVGVALTLPDAFICTQHAAFNVVERSGRTALLVDEFCEAVVNQVATAKGRVPFIAKYNASTQTVMFNVSSAYAWWAGERQRQRRQVLGIEAIRAQLNERELDEQISAQKIGQYVYANGQSENGLIGVMLPAAANAGLDVARKLDIDDFEFTLVD